MYDYYFSDGVANGGTGVPIGSNLDTITANRYNVGGSNAYISGTTDANGMVVTAGGSNEAIAIGANGTVTIRNLNVTGSIVIDGDPPGEVDPIGPSTIGPTITLAWDYADINEGNYHMLNREPGEDSIEGITFTNGFVPFNPTNPYVDYPKARLIIRGRPRQCYTDGFATMRLMQYRYLHTMIIMDIQVSCTHSGYGYTTTVTPWFSNHLLTGGMIQLHVLSLHDTSMDDRYRFGPVHIQFGS